ncbi:hypothetical protein PRUPE_1G073300 [Prunus persica]|uniref:Uncharacterized protein n=1 Tax=Prunus persica TaxID=3760 RepID=M5XP37_PRUPE|nr:hypothetical protein PRUPE_1G073300 [Prunus persica]
MEAHKERREQMMEEESKRKEGGKKNGAAGSAESLCKKKTNDGFDPAAKAIIEECIISHEGEEGGGRAKNPDDVLAFSRSVNKIDSSLE